MVTKEALKKAINQHIIISFIYHGHARIAEPYHYGKMLKNPNNIAINPPRDNYLLVYQIAGSSSSGKLGFKCMRIADIEQLKVHPEQAFPLRKEYKANDKKWAIEWGVT